MTKVCQSEPFNLLANFWALFSGGKWTKLDPGSLGWERRWIRAVAGGQMADFGALCLGGELAPGGQLRRWMTAAADGQPVEFWGLFSGENFARLEPGSRRWGESLEGDRSSSGCKWECVPEECLSLGRGCQVKVPGAWFFYKVP